MNIKLVFIFIFLLMFPAISLYNMGDFPLFRLDFLVQLLFLLYLLAKFFFLGRKIRRHDFILWLLLVFFYSTLNIVNIELIHGFSFFSFLKMYIQLFLFFGIIFLILTMDLRRFSLIDLYRFLYNLGLFFSLYSFYQIFSLNVTEMPFDSIHFNNPNFSEYSIKSGFSGFSRPTSIFMEPVHLGFFLQIPIIISIVARKYKMERPVTVTAIKDILILVSFISTISLFNYLSLLVVVILMFPKYRIYFLIIPIIFIMLLYNDSLGPFARILNIFTDMFSSGMQISDGSMNVRLGKILVGLDIFMDNPFFGVGLNNLSAVSSGYSLGAWFNYDVDFVFTNSFYVQALAEVGIMGVIVMMVLFVHIVKTIKYKGGNVELLFYHKISLALLVVFLVNQDLPFSSPYRLLYFIFIFIAMNKIRSSHRDVYP